MEFRKAVISIILICAYSIGFAHNLIPHNHDHEISTDHMSSHAQKHEHPHGHHQHSTSDHHNHKHIAHENHFDHGLFDLVICLLSEIEHDSADNNDCYYIPAQANNFSAKSLTKVKYASVHFIVFAELDDADNPNACNPEIYTAYLSPPLSSSPHRGPPIIS